MPPLGSAGSSHGRDHLVRGVLATDGGAPPRLDRSCREPRVRGRVALHSWWADRQQRKRREVQDMSRRLREDIHVLDQDFIQAVNDLYRAANRFREQ